MNIVLWILQILLAVAFLGAGIMKATSPKEKLLDRMAWVEGATPAQVKGVGAVEIIGALGLILPWATNIARILTPLAAVGLAITMLLAAALHVKRKEYKEIAPSAILCVLCVVVAIGRFAG